MNTGMLIVAGIVAGGLLAMVAFEFAAAYLVRKGERNGE